MVEKEKKVPVSRSKAAFKERERERKEKEKAQREQTGSAKEANGSMKAAKQEAEKKHFPWKVTAGVLAGVVMLAAAGYVGMSMKYQNTYLPNTRINGMNASGMTSQAVEENMAKEA